MDRRIRQRQENTSGIALDVLTSDDVLLSVTKLQKLLQTSFGPSGFIKVLQNNCGGHMTVTSCASRLLVALTIHKPIHKLIVGSAQCHIARFQDGGIFVTLLISYLITTPLKTTLSRHFVINIYEYLSEISVNYIKSNKFNGKIQLKQCDVNVHVMIAIVRSIIETKSVCSLLGDDLSHICRTVVGAFLSSIPDELGSVLSQESVQIVSIEEHSPDKSCVLDGVLVRIYDLKPVREFLESKSSSLTVAVVTVSLSGDSEDVDDSLYETSDDVKVDAGKFDHLVEFTERLLEMKVDALMCQKVIHPDLQHRLSRRGVLAVERLGKDTCSQVLRVTGCTGIGSTSVSVSAAHLGTVNSVSHISLCGQDYLQLHKTSTPLVTLVICGHGEEMLKELKTVCTSSLSGLYSFMSHHTLLLGGGCWIIQLSHYILTQVRSQEQSLVNEYSCTKYQLREACTTFVSSLHNVIQSLGQNHQQTVANSNYTHVWRVGVDQSEFIKPCSCGMMKSNISDLLTLDTMFERAVEVFNSEDGVVSDSDFLVACRQRNQDVVVDDYRCALNALTTALNTAMSALSIHQFIYDLS